MKIENIIFKIIRLFTKMKTEGWKMYDMKGNFLSYCDCPTKHEFVQFPDGRGRVIVYKWKRGWKK